MARTADEIVALFEDRRRVLSADRERMRLICSLYNNDVVVPLPELQRDELPAVVNLAKQGINQLSQRLGGVMPMMRYVERDYGRKDTARKQAELRRKVNYGWWEANKMNLQMRKRGRFLFAYASSPTVVRPDFKTGMPRWEQRSPLDTYASPRIDVTDFRPLDAMFAQIRTVGWVRDRYPEASAAFMQRRHDDLVDIVEYFDADEVHYVASIRARSWWEAHEQASGPGPIDMAPAGAGVTLTRIANRAEMPWVTIAGNICLDKPVGQFDGLIGMYQAQAQLQALSLIARTKGVFMEEWLVSEDENTEPQVLVKADAMSGTVGVVRGGRFERVMLDPQYATDTGIDRLERSQRVEAGIPADFGGECVDAETEILTADGWRRYDEIGVGTEVLTLNHESGLAEWHPVLQMNVFPAERRTMLEAEGVRHSSLTTLNHRWPVVSRWNGARRWATSAELTTNHRVPIAAMNADVPIEAKWTDAMVELVAWFYTEGHDRGSGGDISQSIKNPGNVDRIRAALTAAFGPKTAGWRYLNGAGQGGVGHDEVPRWHESEPRANGVIRFVLSKHALEAITAHCPGKVPAFGFLRSLTQSQLEMFLHVSMLADNCGARFGQKDPARSDAFAFAAILAGNAVSYRRRVKTEKRPGWREGEYESHLIQVRRRRFANLKENAIGGTKSATFRHVEFEGLVWCPTTPTGTWLARRNGTVYFTGNSASNVRTGRRAAGLLSEAVDPMLQEAHEIISAALEEENRTAIAIDKAYWRNTRKTISVSWGVGKETECSYTPADLWETDRHSVKYPVPGADVHGINVATGQAVGLGVMSKETAQKLNPLIENPEAEKDRIVAERLEEAFLTQIQQMAATPGAGMEPVDLARLIELVESDQMDLIPAFQKVQREAQERQAAQAPPGAPETMPGVSPPGMGAESSIGPTPDQQGLSSLLYSLTSPSLALNTMQRNPVGGA